VKATSEEFERQADPFRRELLAYCYRILGSPHDAEDLVQETMLRAWRAYERFDITRASFRTWLYRIATNACLTALSSSSRRLLPVGLGAHGSDPEAPLVPTLDVRWLEPMPDALFCSPADDPETTVALRGTLRLAFIAAIQYLPARQRAVLILRDVLAFSAVETAGILDTTPAAVNSSLQRARARLNELPASVEPIQEPSDAATRAVIDQYIAAFESADVAALTRLLADEVVLEMPPVPLWLLGREHYQAFIARVFRLRGPDWRMLATTANGQAALAAYASDTDGNYTAHSLQVVSLHASKISHNVVFQNPQLFRLFDLPTTLAR
jgi:RNA polymerase sigma-70 factor (ECF subfamily)